MYSVIQQKWNMWFGFAFFFIIQMWLSNTCYFIMCTFRSFNVIYHQCLELLWVPFKNYRTRFFFLSFFGLFFLFSLSQMFLKSVPRNANGITKCLAPFVCWEHWQVFYRLMLSKAPCSNSETFLFLFSVYGCSGLHMYVFTTCAQYLWRPEKGDGSPLSEIKDCSEASCRCWECNLVI